jgi:flagellar basal-body rod modification protein FlgD
MAYQPITVTNGQVVTTTSATKSATSQSLQDQFLTLLVSQLKNQNPLEPMKNDEFLAQTAQFQALTEMQKLNKSMSAFMSQSQLNNASSLIGKQVTALTSDGDSLTGVVTSAQMNGSDVLLEIDGKFVSLANVTKVEAATAVSDQIDALADLLVDALFGDVDGSELETSAI